MCVGEGGDLNMATSPKAEFRRKRHRLPAHEYIGKKWFFVTICCHNRAPLFADGSCAGWLLEVLRTESTLFGFVIDAYCAMPDHLHFLALGITPTSDLLKFVQSFKQKTAFRYSPSSGIILWQNNFYDHILRSNEGPARVAAYIWLNPVRKGFCKEFQEYPFSGSFSRTGFADSPFVDSAVETGTRARLKDGRYNALLVPCILPPYVETTETDCADRAGWLGLSGRDEGQCHCSCT